MMYSFTIINTVSPKKEAADICNLNIISVEIKGLWRLKNKPSGREIDTKNERT